MVDDEARHFQFGVKSYNHTIANNEHFGIVINGTSRCGFKIVIDTEGEVADFIKIFLVIYHRPVKNQQLAGLTCTTLHMSHHLFATFSKKVLAIGALFDGVRSDHFISTTKIGGERHVNFRCKIALNWLTDVL